MTEVPSDSHLKRLSAQIVVAHACRNPVSSTGLTQLIGAVYETLAGLGKERPAVDTPQPAVPIKKSIFPGYIICLEDGKKMTMLKRYLLRSYGLTPAAYRAKWGLPDSYPMSAPDYAARRATIAKQVGLGRRPVSSAATELAPALAEPVMPEFPVQRFPAHKRGRKHGSKNAKPSDVEVVAE